MRLRNHDTANSGGTEKKSGVFVPDVDLDADERRQAVEYTTPRVGIDGETYWPVDELPGGDDRDN